MPLWTLRPAQPSDAATIAQHRYPALQVSDPALDVYAAWVSGAIRREVYLGWLIDQSGTVLAGAGLTLLEWGPTRDNANPWRARLVNVYTAPQARRQGWARALALRALEEAQARGLAVGLATTAEARALYVSLGFVPSLAEMRRSP